ncbi:MAG: hypothetical protein MJ183_01080 [Treponemataceae bacterium]|nr:hypothetical protein [Treponemataceae bacterium]
MKPGFFVRTLIVLLSAAMVAMFSGCGSVPDSEPAEQEQEAEEIIAEVEPQVEPEPEPVAEPEPEPFYKKPTPENLTGKWVCENGKSFEYPFDVDGRRYLLYRAYSEDFSGWIYSLYEYFNELYGADYYEVAKKASSFLEFSPDVFFLKKLYGAATKEKYPNPVVDKGIEVGIKFEKTYGYSYGTSYDGVVYYLIPEEFFLRNLDFFVFQEEDVFVALGNFYFGSNLIADLVGGGENRYFLTEWRQFN